MNCVKPDFTNLKHISVVYGTTGAGYSCSRPQGRLLSSDLDGVLKGWHGPPKPCFDPPCLISSFRFRTTFAIYATWRFDTLVPRSLVRSGPVFPFGLSPRGFSERYPKMLIRDPPSTRFLVGMADLKPFFITSQRSNGI